MSGTIDLTGGRRWPGQFRPSGRLDAYADRLEALAEDLGTGELDAAALLRGAELTSARFMRERLMAKMLGTKGKPGPVTKEDIPPLGDLTDPLTHLGRRTSFTVEEAREAFSALADKGNDIDTLAKRMYDAGQKFNWWRDNDGDIDMPPDHLALWRELDAELVTMIWDGWMIWSKTAWILQHITKEQRREFTKVHGFLGNSRVGWHALGRKVLLHSRWLTLINPFRRRVSGRRYD